MNLYTKKLNGINSQIKELETPIYNMPEGKEKTSALIKLNSAKKKINEYTDLINSVASEESLAKKEHRFYKSRQSFNNREVYRKANTMPCAANKNDKRKSVTTSKYSDIREFYKEYSEYKYVAAGLNSTVRQYIVIDIDDSDRTSDEIAREIEKIIGKKPNVIKVNPLNGHKQAGLFLDCQIVVKHIEIDDLGYATLTNTTSHNDYLNLVRALNSAIPGGDVCYTGYVCQNPYNDPENTITYHDELFNPDVLLVQLKHYFIGECCSELSNKDKRLMLKAFDSGEWWKDRKRRQKSIEKIVKKDNFYKDEEDCKINAIMKKLDKCIDSIQLLNEKGYGYKNSYDKKYFVLTSQVLKRWKLQASKDIEDKNELITHLKKNIHNMVNEVKENIIIDCPEGTGYTSLEETNRITSDFYQLIGNYDNIVWDKISYTPKARMMSLVKRNYSKQCNMKRMAIAYAHLTNRQVELSIAKTARLIYETVKHEISYHTIHDFVFSYRNLLKYLSLNRKNLNRIFYIVDDFKYFDYVFFNVSNASLLTVNPTIQDLLSTDSISYTLNDSYMNMNDNLIRNNDISNKNISPLTYNNKKNRLWDIVYSINDYKYYKLSIDRGRVPRTREIPIFTVGNLVDLAMA